MKRFFTNKILIRTSFLFVLFFPLSLNAQETFSNPNQALKALTQAVKSSDMTQSLESVFGPNTSDLWKTGDAVQDKNMKDHFLNRLSQGAKWVVGDKTHKVLLLGKDQWPFPIPLVKENNKWNFDIKTGREEILNRRVGANELDAIHNEKEYVRAQKEYAALPSSKGDYAQKFVSNPGKKNGLYWPSDNPNDQSPIGAKVTQAVNEGYKAPGANRTLLYHGYFYRMLSSKAKSFALIAYPAKWNDSGVMTFIVNQNGQVMQKNLGKDTLDLAAKITAYNPDSSWKKVN